MGHELPESRNKIKKFTFDSLLRRGQSGPVLEDDSTQWYAVCHVCEDCLYSVKLWVCNFYNYREVKVQSLGSNIWIFFSELDKQ